jgi:hypothetical protein
LANSDADIRATSSQPIDAHFDLEALRKLSDQPSQYGACLTQMLFSSTVLRVAFGKARAQADTERKTLRLRLFIGPTAEILHSIRWELLLDPEKLTPLATDQNIIFSRYLASMDAQPVRLKQKGNLRGLIAVAHPQGLPKTNTDEEVDLAKKGLVGIALQTLPEGRGDAGYTRRATLANLLDALSADPAPDVLYLACHGKIVNNQPYIFLEDEQGKLDQVSGADFCLRLQQLQARPRLVVLVSCQSAGTGTGDALSAFGPRLAEIGIPAVIAMQADFSMRTAARFLPKFFEELQHDGQIDRAMAAARSRISDQDDSWVPVLFMRLKSGRLWYKPGFADQKAAQRMPSMLDHIEEMKMTPILGPGLIEPVLGSLREIAQRWATDFNYPLRPHERESLPQVAQFLATNQTISFPFSNLVRSLKKHINQTSMDGKGDTKLSLNKLIEQVVAPRWTPGGMEPHQFLARLDLPIYITANQDTLMEAALRYENKAPRTVLCPWNDEIVQPDVPDLSVLDGEEIPTSSPIVFHLFGLWDKSESMVLTEDDYFKFLLRLSSNQKTIPSRIREALADSGLLFLGFQLEEWVFRVIFHSLLSLPGASRRNHYAHIAAQIEMEDERIVEPALARQYLEQYFREGAKIDAYWGSPEEFIQAMASELANR